MSDSVIEISATIREDVPAIRAMTVAVGVFNAEEVATVDELLEEYFAHGAEASGYHFQTCRVDGAVAGFTCFGPRALTQAVYDLFWIVTAPEFGRRGIGGKLLESAERAIAERGGRIVIAETSGRADYASTRAFYDKYGYVAEARIVDFYAPGDDLVIYVRRLPG